MNKKDGLSVKIIQMAVVIVISVLMAYNFILANTIQGTAKVINYTGLIRGGTQRLVKLELSGAPNDELIRDLDNIMEGLRYGGGEYHLERLKTKNFQESLEGLAEKWVNLKKDIIEYRKDPSKGIILVTDSETYYALANVVVGSAEMYSDDITMTLRVLELILACGIVFLIASNLQQMVTAIRLSRQNDELSFAAYVDRMTGIPSRRRCEELIYEPMNPEVDHHCVVMFDLNNLKSINDLYGHHAGDKLIKAFADVLKKFTSDKIFVGRYGGDEFLMIIRDYEEAMVKRLLQDIQELVNEYNQKNTRYPIRYACGYEYGGESLHRMLERADAKMYENKRLMKSRQ